MEISDKTVELLLDLLRRQVEKVDNLVRLSHFHFHLR